MHKISNKLLVWFAAIAIFLSVVVYGQATGLLNSVAGVFGRQDENTSNLANQREIDQNVGTLFGEWEGSPLNDYTFGNTPEILPPDTTFGQDSSGSGSSTTEVPGQGGPNAAVIIKPSDNIPGGTSDNNLGGASPLAIDGNGPIVEESDSGGEGASLQGAEDSDKTPDNLFTDTSDDNNTSAEVLPETDVKVPEDNSEEDWRAIALLEHNKMLFKAALANAFAKNQARATRQELAYVSPLGQSNHSIGSGRVLNSDIPNTVGSQSDNQILPSPKDANVGSTYGRTLTVGSQIPVVLQDDIKSELPGLVRAMVTRDVYDSDTFQTLLIPAGSQLIGSYDTNTSAGQSRLFVSWDRVRFVDGTIVDLEKAAAVDTSGAAGITGTRSNGFLKSIFQATLLNLASNAANGGSSAEQKSGLENAVETALGQSVRSTSEQVLNSAITKGTLFYVQAGTRFNVQLQRDFEFLETSNIIEGGRQPKVGANNKSVIGYASANEKFLKYDRDAYTHWIDADGDCQNERHELLIKASTKRPIFTSDGCAVVTGSWNGPYSAKIYTEAKNLHIDHIVPLAWAHPRGTYSFSKNKKTEFANNPANLLVVNGRLNMQKGAKSPLKWMPPNEAYHCEYVERFNQVIQIYSLSPSPDEVDALNALQKLKCEA